MKIVILRVNASLSRMRFKFCILKSEFQKTRFFFIAWLEQFSNTCVINYLICLSHKQNKFETALILWKYSRKWILLIRNCVNAKHKKRDKFLYLFSTFAIEINFMRCKRLLWVNVSHLFFYLILTWLKVLFFYVINNDFRYFDKKKMIVLAIELSEFFCYLAIYLIK